MLLSLVHPDLLNESQSSPLPIPALKRGNRNRTNAIEDINNIFHIKENYALPYASLDDMYMLYKLCANNLCEDDFKFIINYCKRLQQGIVDPDIKIILTGNKSQEIYKFITFNLALSDREKHNLQIALPVMIIHSDLEPEIYYGANNYYRIIKC